MKSITKTLLFISLILLLSVVLTGCRDKANLDNFEFNSSTGSITGSKAEVVSDLTIPSQIDGVEVKVIGKRAFKDGGISLLNIPKSVSTIMAKAFSNNELTSVELGDGVEVIAEQAFDRNNLTTVKIPDAVRVIGRRAFAYNELTAVELEGSVEVIEEQAFDSNNLASVELPESVEVIGDKAFNDNELTLVVIGSRVDISSNSFDGNFKEVYDTHNKTAGAYVRDNLYSDWYKQE